MSAHDPSSSLTTYLLAALNEQQLVQQDTQRELDAEKASSRQLQERLDALHETIAQLREELHAKQIAADERSTILPARESKHAVTRRPPPSDHTTSDPLPKKRRNSRMRENTIISLSSLRMKAGSWEELYLIFSWEHKAIQFFKNDEALQYQGSKIQLGGKHAQTVLCNTKSSTAVVLVGSADIISRGRIWLEFPTTDDLEMFLEAANHMNDRTIFKALDTEKFAYVCNASEIFFKSVTETVESELEAMRHRHNRAQIPVMNIEPLSHSHRAYREETTKGEHADEAILRSSKIKAVDTHNTLFGIESETDVQKLHNDIDRLERELITLDKKIKSAIDEAASAFEEGEEGSRRGWESRERLARELSGQKGQKEVQIARLRIRIAELTSPAIKLDPEQNDAAVSRADVTSNRASSKRKRY